MKITRLSTYQVPPRWLFLKIETDEGVTGWGEPVIEGRAATVETAVRELECLLLGRNPLEIERLWNEMYRGAFYRGGPILMSAIAGIDQALWDIKGKVHGLPVHEMLGGKCRDTIQVYTWIGGDRPSDVAAYALAAKDSGFGAVKMNATEELQFLDSYAKIDAVTARVAAIREACGRDFGIAVDFHGRVHRPMAKTLIKALEEFDLLFIEEPLLSEHLEVFPELAASTRTPIATGERLFSRYDFKRLFAHGGVDIIQPDLSHAGGITEVRKIAAMAEAYDIALAPHCPLGPLALASCLHVDAVSHNAVIQEQSMGIHYNQGNDVLDYVVNKDVFAFENGRVAFPAGPGLGVVIDENAVAEGAARFKDWKNPIWRHRDGSIAEW